MNGFEVIPENSLAHVREAILQSAHITQDLEEQISNVEIAEQIVKRPSLAIDNGEDLSSTKSSGKNILNMSPVVTRNSRIIEPIPASVVPRDSTTRQQNGFASKAPFQRRETTASEAVASSSTPLTRYQSLMANVRTRGSLTSSEEEESPVKLNEGIDPVSFSATGAMVTCNATQTPEDMNSSDEEHTEEEDKEGVLIDPGRTKDGREGSGSDSTGDSSSETEEWDSEADTHTSPSDDDTEKNPHTTYYEVVNKSRVSPAERLPRPAVRPQNGRSLKDQFISSLPWARRPTFTSMQFPATKAASHPRHNASQMPTSQSFPQDFFHMVSNPFFTTSLHDAYRQACAFKEWYETQFPDQINLAMENGGDPDVESDEHRLSASGHRSSAVNLPHGFAPPAAVRQPPALSKRYSE